MLSSGWRVRFCDCSFYTDRIGHLYASDLQGSVKFEFTDSNAVRQYGHGTRTAVFIECAVCSAYMGAVMEMDGQRLAVLNIQYLLERLALPEAYKLVCSGENTEVRLDRRAKTWTSVTEWGVGLALTPRIWEKTNAGCR